MQSYLIWISDRLFQHPLVMIFLILPKSTNLEVLLTFYSPLILSLPSQYSSQINLAPWNMQNVLLTIRDSFIFVACSFKKKL